MAFPTPLALSPQTPAPDPPGPSPASVAEIIAPEIPSRHLPPVTYRPMPEPPPFRQVVGPGVILVAGAIGSGEFIFWPYLATKEGLSLLWAAVVGILLQFFLNTEVQRYTLATGETAITGFARLWRPWGLLFATLPMLGFIFPGIALSAATTLTFGLGGNAVLVCVIGLLLAGVAFSISPVVYQTLERFQTVVVAVMLAFLAVATFTATDLAAWGEAAKGLVSVGTLPTVIAPAVFFSALVYAGSGGLGNLTVSNWVRDKNWGMGAYIPRLVSPITGVEVAAPALGHFFPLDDENLRRFRRWWRLGNLEQLLTFVLLGTISIVAMSVIAYSALRGVPTGGGIEFIRAEGEQLGLRVGRWFATVFFLVGGLKLFSTVVGNLDIAARVVADSFKVDWLRESPFWSESKLYLVTIWLQILFGITILVAGLEAPLLLLSLSGLVGGLVLFASAVLLIQLNRRLPPAIRLGGFRLVMMVLAALFYGAFAAQVAWTTLFSWLQ